MGHDVLASSERLLVILVGHKTRLRDRKRPDWDAWNWKGIPRGIKD